MDRTILAVQGIVPRLAGAILAFVTVPGMAAGCAARQAAGPEPAGIHIQLTLLDTVIIPSTTTAPDGRRDAWFGSLSGLARDPRTGRYLAVVDDRQPSRVAWLDFSVRAGRLSVVRGEVQPIRPGHGIDARLVNGADLEAVAALPDGTWIASEEGHFSNGAPGQLRTGAWPPALLTIARDLSVTRIQAWPERFELGPERGGVRDNQGFESLTATPDGRLIAGLEQPLHGDLEAPLRNGRPFGGGRGGPSRIVELVRRGEDWLPRREWLYRLDPTTMREGFDAICDDGESGLTELLALNEAQLLALERACLINSASRLVRNTVRLYLVDLTYADDVSLLVGGALDSARAVRKTLLLDFDTLIPRWPPPLAGLDNFEALAFGPPGPDGGRTLLVMSDDNFRATQNTVIVWFEIGEKRQEIGGRNSAPGTYGTALYPTPRTVSSSRGRPGSSSR